MVNIAISNPTINPDKKEAARVFIKEASEQREWIESTKTNFETANFRGYLAKQEGRTLSTEVQYFDEMYENFIHFREIWDKVLKEEIKRVKDNQNDLSLFSFNFDAFSYNYDREKFLENFKNLDNQRVQSIQQFYHRSNSF